MVVLLSYHFISALRIWNIKIIRLLKEFRADKKRRNINVALYIWIYLFRYRIYVSVTSDHTNDSGLFFPVSILVSFGTYFSLHTALLKY